MKIADLELTRENLAQMMDYSVLGQEADEEAIIEACRIAKEYNFKGVHPNPIWAQRVSEELDGTGIETGYVLSFPFGANPTEIKIAEAKYAVKILQGKPWVVDMVTNIGKLRGKEYDYYRRDIAEVAKVCHDAGVECKAILEVAFLTDDEIRAACELAAEAGADWVKTSTGRGGSPTLAQLKLMRDSSPKHVKVKCAGFGAHWSPTVALTAIMAGAERLGTRRAPWIIEEITKLMPELLKKIRA
ncbi:MAG: deoxyribose-phosphate aldolase [Firmicutes bacterium]|nr:deoxyribose-phosphate aldolase [Bacillota bacterium]